MQPSFFLLSLAASLWKSVLTELVQDTVLYSQDTAGNKTRLYPKVIYVFSSFRAGHTQHHTDGEETIHEILKVSHVTPFAALKGYYSWISPTQ